MGGNGSMMLTPHVTGVTEIPFTIGDVDPNQPFVHVFDDMTVNAIFEQCNTITDFVSYLGKKEAFVRSGRLVSAAGEEEILAYYLTHMNDAGEHDIVLPSNVDGMVLDQGFYEDYLNSDQFRRKVEADRISYAWDRLIEEFSGNVMAGTLYNASVSSVSYHEQGLRLLAREPRTRRRMLATSLLEMLGDDSLGAQRRARVVEPSVSRDPYYVFLALLKLQEVTHEQYRTVRTRLAVEYCRVVRLDRPNAHTVVCVALDLNTRGEGSEDLVVYDGSTFPAEERTAATEARRNFGILQKIQRWATSEKEYPDAGRRDPIRPLPTRGGRFPGTGRNERCPCGSGVKYKKCCGP
jgi:hypothetical protein